MLPQSRAYVIWLCFQAMFTLPGSLPRALIRKLRKRSLVDVQRTLSELDAEERAYKERMALQQQTSKAHEQPQQQQPDNDSYSEETETSDNAKAAVADDSATFKSPPGFAADTDSSPSLNVLTNHDNTNPNPII